MWLYWSYFWGDIGLYLIDNVLWMHMWESSSPVTLSFNHGNPSGLATLLHALSYSKRKRETYNHMGQGAITKTFLLSLYLYLTPEQLWNQIPVFLMRILKSSLTYMNTSFYFWELMQWSSDDSIFAGTRVN